MSAPAPDASRREPVADDAPHVLVVDDDQRIRDLVARLLLANGFRVSTAGDAASARNSMRGLAFDLVLVDVMMPGESGLSLTRELKAVSNVPVCLLTARAEMEERIEGLETGADDYITKPFEPRELVLRLRNMLRRARPQAGPTDEVRMGEYSFNVARGDLRRGEEVIKLTERERDLMRVFAARPGIAVARHELTTDMTTGSERAIDVQINRLRRKIEVDPANPVYLQTVRSKGYILYVD